MKIKLIDFGVPEHQRPYRPHGNDAGADVYLPYEHGGGGLLGCPFPTRTLTLSSLQAGLSGSASLSPAIARAW